VIALVPSQARFSIRDLCVEFGVTARALRYYEVKGLLRPERRGQARIYSANDRARLALVLRGKRVGFALDEIKELLDLHAMDPRERGALGRARDRFVRKIADLKRQRADIDRAIADLKNGCEWLEARLDDVEPSEDLKARAAAFEALARSYLHGDGVGAATTD
jgi:DNA-binding transcriptional MerR regulator